MHVWRVVRVPTVAKEDRRHLHRELARLTTDRTRCINQIKGLLAAHGARLTSLRGALPQLAHLTQWDAVGRHRPAARRAGAPRVHVRTPRSHPAAAERDRAGPTDAA